ncbi:LuxR C-terminal-related transcriptional regulator [Bermanella sp. R86510]|uniref:helix-turn-helix transcriptional regulator n=1 Tax=unclassified Bermanella TaxID=2627862 RepID=UPI0037CCABD5
MEKSAQKPIKAQVLVAGPGFGKSTLLHQYAQADECKKGGIVLHEVVPEVSELYEFTNKVLDALSQLPADQSVSVLIDDIHHLNEAETSTLFAKLVDALKRDDHIYLASRRMPNILLVRSDKVDINLLQEPELLKNTEGKWPLMFFMQQKNWHQANIESQLGEYLASQWGCHFDEQALPTLSILANFDEISESLWQHLEPNGLSLSYIWQEYRFLVPDDDQQGHYRWISEAQRYLQTRFPLSIDKRERLLETAADFWLRHGSFQMLIDTLNDNHEELLASHSIIIPLVVALIFTRRFHQARYVIEQMSDASAESDHKEVINILNNTLALFTVDDEERVEPLASLKKMKLKNGVIHCVALLVSAYQSFYQGKLDETARKARDALLYMNERQQTYLASLTEMLLIACDKYRGYTAQAVQQLVIAFNSKEENAKDPVWHNYATGMIIMYYEKNDLKSAEEICEKIMPHINSSCATEVIIHVYLYYARILDLLSDSNKSIEYLIRLQRFLSMGNYPRYQGKLVAERMRQAVAKNDYKCIKYLCEKFNIESFLDNRDIPNLDVFDYLLQARAMQLLYESQYQEVINLLEPLRDELLKYDYHERALVAEAQIIVAHNNLGKKARASILLKQAIHFYGWPSFNRTLFDEAPMIIPIFSSLIGRGDLTPSSLFLSYYRDVLFPQYATDAFDMKSRYNALTKKEREVMMLLAQGLSNQEIADDMSVAATTIKWHLKNIYRKLSLDNRSAAMAYMHKVQPSNIV